MLNVVGCLTNQHDLRLVALAAVICVLASFAAVDLLHHARAADDRMRDFWFSVAAVASGSGIWATHFIAMLAYAPDLPSGYDLSLTLLSLVAAVLLTGAGLRITALRGTTWPAWLGGAVIGGGIAAMHYTGMAAYEVAGRIRWDPALVAASLAVGMIVGGAALGLGLRRGSFRRKAAGALLLTLAICGHHFTAMGAITIVPDPLVAVSDSALPNRWLAVIVAVASLAILLLACAALTLDGRERRLREQARLVSSLANAAVEGIMICDGERIVTVNDSLADLLGRSPASLIGASASEVLPSAVLAPQQDPGKPDQPGETELRGAEGEPILVEMIQHRIEVGGRPHRAVAVRDLRARRRAEQHIHFLAHHDALTKLPNRASFNARLDQEIERAVRTGRPVAVLCLDLDRFKEVNDVFGHAAGDAMLQALASCVTSALDEGQVLARLGGDEFAVIVPGLDRAAVGCLANTVLQAIRSENAASPDDLVLAASIGIALCPADAADRQTLMSHADTALYRAKRDGRGTCRFFEAQMSSQVRDRRNLEHDLRRAIVRGEFHLAYQPQTRISTGEVVGFEALLRWQHPERGNVPPDQFILVAEEIGAIDQIGAWVLREACREAATWSRPLRVAVNVSPVQLRSPAFACRVREVLRETGLRAHRLELEITETALIRDRDRTLATLRLLKELGLRIAMDDFGTGYSSLSNLRAFPFDKIKIDRSFVRSVDSSEQAAAIVRAVLGLGHGLGLPVLAEGVETRAELAFLGREACQEAQGYLMGRPAPIGAFDHLTRAPTRAPGSDEVFARAGLIRKSCAA